MAQGQGTTRQSNASESTALLASGNVQHIATTSKPAPQSANMPSGCAPPPLTSKHDGWPQQSSSSRPNFALAVTTAAALQASAPCSGTTTPILSRPPLNRAFSTSAVTPSTARPEPSPRPSLIRRATDILGLNATTSNTCRNAPQPPSHWTDHAHRKPLLQVWDSIHNAAATSAPSKSNSHSTKSLTAQLFATEKQMLQHFAELAEGDVLLTGEWIEFVLGVCLRQPFCTAENMGRFEVLAASAGSRANWGPW